MKVYFIGAGAGDPELITVRGKKILEKSDTIIYAGSLVNPKILDYAGEGAEIYSSAHMDLEGIVERISAASEDNRIVARLHTGDPSIYGALQEQVDYLEELGIEYEIVPGVSSFLAAAATLGREFTLPKVSQTVIITRLAGKTPVPAKESLEKLAAHRASMAIFLSVQMINDVVEKLTIGYPEETPVAVVAKASWPDEQVITGKLSEIAAKVNRAGIERTALVLVGDFIDCEYSRSHLYARKNPGKSEAGQRKAILAVSFGTSYKETRNKTIGAWGERFEKTFPEYEVRRAFTSEFIIEKLKRRDDVEIDTPEEALKKLRDLGYSEVIVQPLHIIAGNEYHELVEEVRSMSGHFDLLVPGKPLLSETKDYFQLANAILSKYRECLGQNEALVLMGHGSDHSADSAYSKLDYVFTDLEGPEVLVGTVEGYPGLGHVIDKLNSMDIEKVHLVPLMLVAGEHVQNDMAGEDDDSWKNILKNEGFDVETYVEGLGESELVREMYVGKIEELI